VRLFHPLTVFVFLRRGRPFCHPYVSKINSTPDSGMNFLTWGFGPKDRIFLQTNTRRRSTGNRESSLSPCELGRRTHCPAPGVCRVIAVWAPWDSSEMSYKDLRASLDLEQAAG